MAFGEFENRQDERGHWIVIPYNGDPAIRLFLPAEKSQPSTVSIYWQGRITSGLLTEWVLAAVSFRPEYVTVVADVWGEGLESNPLAYGPSDLGGLPKQIRGHSDATATVMISGVRSPEFYVWAQLDDVGETEGEIGIKLDARELALSSGRALVILLLQSSRNSYVSVLEYEELLDYLRVKALPAFDETPAARMVA